MVRHKNNTRLAPRPAHSVLTFSLLSLVAMASLLILASTAQAAQVTLAWDPNSQEDVTGYNIYWGTTSGSYPNQADAGDADRARNRARLKQGLLGGVNG